MKVITFIKLLSPSLTHAHAHTGTESYRQTNKHAHAHARAHAHTGAPEWAGIVLHVLSRAGTPPSTVGAMLRSVPPELSEALQTMGGVLKLVQVDLLLRSMGRANCHAPEPRPWSEESEGLAMEELSLFEQSDISVERHTYEPVCFRATEIYANPAFLRLFGLTPDCMAGLAAHHQLPNRMSQVRPPGVWGVRRGAPVLSWTSSSS